jgi:hypothetical protein
MTGHQAAGLLGVHRVSLVRYGVRKRATAWPYRGAPFDDRAVGIAASIVPLPRLPPQCALITVSPLTPFCASAWKSRPVSGVIGAQNPATS